MDIGTFEYMESCRKLLTYDNTFAPQTTLLHPRLQDAWSYADAMGPIAWVEVALGGFT